MPVRSYKYKNQGGHMKNALKSFLIVLAVSMIGIAPTVSHAKVFYLDLGGNRGQVALHLTNANAQNAIDDFTGTFAVSTGINGRISDYYRSDTSGVRVVELSWEGSCRGSVSASPEYSASDKTLSLKILGGRDCNGPIARAHLIFNENSINRTPPVATTSKSFHMALGNDKFLKLFLTNVTQSDNYTGVFENQQSGAQGTVNTIHNSNLTGVQILEMAWQGSCPGSITVSPSYNAGDKKLTMTILGGNDCNGPVNRSTFVMEDCPHSQISNSNSQGQRSYGGAGHHGQNPGTSTNQNPNRSNSGNGSGQTGRSHAGNAHSNSQGGHEYHGNGNHGPENHGGEYHGQTPPEGTSTNQNPNGTNSGNGSGQTSGVFQPSGNATTSLIGYGPINQ